MQITFPSMFYLGLLGFTGVCFAHFPLTHMQLVLVVLLSMLSIVHSAGIYAYSPPPRNFLFLPDAHHAAHHAHTPSIAHVLSGFPLSFAFASSFACAFVLPYLSVRKSQMQSPRGLSRAAFCFCSLPSICCCYSYSPSSKITDRES